MAKNYPFKKQYLICISYASSIIIKIPLYRCQGTVSNSSDIIRRTHLWDLATMCKKCSFHPIFALIFQQGKKGSILLCVLQISGGKKSKKNVNVFCSENV